MKLNDKLHFLHYITPFLYQFILHVVVKSVVNKNMRQFGVAHEM